MNAKQHITLQNCCIKHV